MNIVLIGYRCCGKTSVGRLLAGDLKRKICDTDTLITERVGSAINEFVRVNGWKCFREIEKQIISEVSKNDNQVIATGGGAVMEESNVRNLKKTGRLYWLNASPEVLKNRMKEDTNSDKNRPPLSDKDAIEEITQILNERKEVYRHVSDFVVDTSHVAPREVADLILKDMALLK